MGVVLEEKVGELSEGKRPRVSQPEAGEGGGLGLYLLAPFFPHIFILVLTWG